MTTGSENIGMVLASGSPRRIEILRRYGLSFRVLPAEIDESIFPGEDVFAYCDRVAREKWLAVAARQSVFPGEILIAADTIVALERVRFGKPVSREDAFRMLRALSGRVHVVHTALVVGMKTSGGFSLTATAADTTVNMALLSEDLISAYVESGDPFGKAGGYAIQNPDFRLVSSFAGCYASVVGLPICHLDALLRRMHAAPAETAEKSCRYRLEGHCDLDCAALKRGMPVSRETVSAAAPVRNIKKESVLNEVQR